MEFLNPSALYGLLALPLLLIPYLMRRKPRRYVFSSLQIFNALSANPTVRPWRRLRLPPILFLQLLLLALMIFALGEPVFTARPSKVAVVIDNSASMQALEGGKSRFVIAQEKAVEIVSHTSFGAAVLDIYLTAPRLARFGGASFSPFEAARALRGLKPVDLGDAPVDYNSALLELARQHQYDRMYLITDRPAAGQSGAARIITVGQPRPNLAITSFAVQHGSLADSRLSASVQVANFAADEARVKLTVRGSGSALAARDFVVSAGGQASASFEGLPARPYYEAEIDTEDALALDNRRFAVASTAKTLRILGISPRPRELMSLRAISGVELDIVAPEDYEKTDRSRYGLEIFHFAAPAVLPRNPTLFILPPKQNGLVDLAGPASNPAISAWNDGHPLTRYVNFSLFRPRYARALSPRAPGERIISSRAGPLVYATTKHGINYLVLGFDPFPYLGQENLPMSIFTVNVVDWFFTFSGAPGKATGEPIPVSAARAGDRIITPAGERISLRPGASVFPATLYQGIYQVIRDNEEQLIAVNLRDIEESDLRQPAPVGMSGESDNKTGTSVLLPFWPYFLLAALSLLLLEWFIRRGMALGGQRIEVRRKHAV